METSTTLNALVFGGPPTMLTVKQACQALAIGRSQLWCLARSGRIRTVRIGKRGVRIPMAEIDRFIRESLEGDQSGGGI